MLNCLKKTFKIKIDSCEIIDLFNFQNNLTWPNSTILNSICDQSISGGDDRLVTYDLAKFPIRSEQEILCTTAKQYNPYIWKGKNNSVHRVSHRNPSHFIYLYEWLLKDPKYSLKIAVLKNGVCQESTPHRPICSRDYLAWRSSWNQSRYWAEIW